MTTPEEEHPHYIGESDFERDRDLPDSMPTTLRKERDISVKLDDNTVEVAKETVRAMHVFKETEHDTRTFRMFSDPGGWDGIVEADDTFYSVNYSAPSPHSDSDEGRFIQWDEISEERVVEMLENHFDEFKLGRSLRPL